MLACGVVLVTIAVGGARDLARVIYNGEFDAFLAQPRPTLLYVLDRRSCASGADDLVSGIGLIALSGAVRIAAAPVVALAAIASAAVMASSGCSSGAWPSGSGLSKPRRGIASSC